MSIANASNTKSVHKFLIIGWILSGFLFASALSMVFDLKLIAAMLGALLAITTACFYFNQVWMLMLFLLPFAVEIGGEKGAGGVGLTLPTEGLIGVLALAFVIRTSFKMKFSYTLSPLNAPIFVFFLCCLISIFTSEQPIVSLKATARDMGYIFAGFYLGVTVLTSRERIIRVLELVLFSSILLTFYGFYTQIASGGFRTYQDIALPFFKNHCIYAGYLTFILAIALAFAVEYLRYLNRGIVFFSLVVLASGVLLSFVRGAWLSLIGLAFFYVWIFRNRIDFKIVLVAIVILVFLITAVSALDLWPTIMKRVNTLTDTTYVANFDRLDRWISAFRMYKANPIIGVGYGTYADRRDDGYIVYNKAYSSKIRMGAHSLYLELMAETGTLGILAFLWIIWRFYREGLRLLAIEEDHFRRALLGGAMGGILTYLIHAVVNNLGPSDKIYMTFWVLIAVIPITWRLRQRDESLETSHESSDH